MNSCFLQVFALSLKIEAHVEISLSSGSLTQNMVAAQDSGMVVVKETATGSNLRRSVAAFASSR